MPLGPKFSIDIENHRTLDLHLGEWMEHVHEEFLRKCAIQHKCIALHLHGLDDIQADQIASLATHIAPKLIKINISDCSNLSWQSQIRKILEKATRIEVFEFKRNSWVNDIVTEYIGKKFQKTIRSLTLESCPEVTDQTLYQLSKRCFNLQSLSLHCCPNITDVGLGETILHSTHRLKTTMSHYRIPLFAC